MSIELFDKILKVTGGYIAGGACRSILMSQPIRDVDVFFTTQTEFFKAQLRIAPVAKLITRTHNAATYRFNDADVQIVCTRFKDPKTMISEYFDFDCCKCYYLLGDSEITQSPECRRSIKTKQLTCNKLAFPYGALIRLPKYIGYGFEVPVLTFRKIAEGIRSFRGDDLFYDDEDVE